MWIRRAPDTGESGDDGDNGGISTKPLAWAIIPLVAVLTIALAVLIICRRRRRRRNPGQSQELSTFRNRILTPGGHLVYSAGGRRNRHGRWAPWSGTRSAEGLNELGEAPPPYKQTDEDLEAGQRPPEYNVPRQPETAHVRSEDRRFSEASGSGSQRITREQDDAEDTYERPIRGLTNTERAGTAPETVVEESVTVQPVEESRRSLQEARS